MPKKKRYFFNVVEEMIMNENAEKFCAGRIEVYDNKDDRGYACYEARFLISIGIIPKWKEIRGQNELI
jgi:hypothetical protein